MQTTKWERCKLNRCVPPTKSHTLTHTSSANATFTFMHGNTVKNSLNCDCVYSGGSMCVLNLYLAGLLCEWEKCVFLSPSLCHPVSPSISRFFLSGKQKNAAAIATESKGRPGPGLSPLEHPDWSRPTVWALLPCGRRGRQFSERCRGRRAISAVLSGRIYTAGFFHSCDIFCGWIKSLSVNAHIHFSMKWREDLLTLLLSDKENVRELFKVGRNLTPSYFFHIKNNENIHCDSAVMHWRK